MCAASTVPSFLLARGRKSLSLQQAQGVEHFSPKPGGREHRAELHWVNLGLEKTNEAASPKTCMKAQYPQIKVFSPLYGINTWSSHVSWSLRFLALNAKE